MKRKLPQAVTSHIVGKVSGVKPTDSRIEAANKAIAVMQMGGLDTRRAIAMRDAAIKRGIR
jgi:hypothetical protein